MNPLTIKKDSIKKIAVFRALYLGDMLCIIPAIRAIRRAFPHAHISLVGLPWQKEFAERFSHYFDEFIFFPGWPGLPEQEVNTSEVITFLQTMNDRQFDLVLQMQGNGILTNSMCALWGARMVCGLRRHNEYCPDELLFPVSEDDDHEITRFLKLLDVLEIPDQGSDLEFPFLEDEKVNFENNSEKLNISKGNYICVHPGARDKRRRWSIGNFVFIIDQLSDKGYKIVLTGSAEEAPVLKEIEDRAHSSLINIVEQLGHVPLGDLGQILKHASLLISNDTGVSHIATALDVRSVVIFSPYSVMSRWAPLNTNLHKSISPEKANDVSYVLSCALDQLETQVTV